MEKLIFRFIIEQQKSFRSVSRLQKLYPKNIKKYTKNTSSNHTPVQSLALFITPLAFFKTARVVLTKEFIEKMPHVDAT